jgi:hypothetical protein
MAHCEVTMNTPDCEAPLGVIGVETRSRCFRCGGPCCKKCSALVTDGGRRRRICADCLESEREEISIPDEVAQQLGLTARRAV